jgi:hypothetical protein
MVRSVHRQADIRSTIEDDGFITIFPCRGISIYAPMVDELLACVSWGEWFTRRLVWRAIRPYDMTERCACVGGDS